jgi:hypothetical protein
MKEIHNIVILFCVIGVAINALLVFGLNRQWGWVIDPPTWMAVFYFPAFVKVIFGPQYVLTTSYLTAYGGLVMSLASLIQVLFP